MNRLSEKEIMHTFPPVSKMVQDRHNDEIPSVSARSSSTATTATATTITTMRSSLRAHYGSLVSQEHHNPATAALGETVKGM